MFAIESLFFLVVLIFSAIIHEYAHGVAALFLGDPTAKNQGRLTLNPIPHIDPIGTLLVPGLLYILGTGFLIGWAKPVPYNPYNLSNQKWGPAMVGFAGPVTNMLIAFIFALAIRLFPTIPLDLMVFLGMIVYANIILGIFNLLPIPPLDGSKVLFALLPASMSGVQSMIERYGVYILILVLLYGSSILSILIVQVTNILLGTENNSIMLDALFS